MNIKKLFALLAGVSLVAQTVVPSAGVFGANYSEELQGAYDWAYSKGVTTMPSIDNANMYGAITRAEMAKMLSVYAMEVLGYTPDTSKACSFTDIDSVKGDLHDFIIKSCQLGLMGQGITKFRPYDTISRAEFGTALSRTLWGNAYEGGTPYYAKHLSALKAAGIMTQIANAESTKEVRGYVMLMLQRSDEGDAAATTADESTKLLACVEKCGEDTECAAACILGDQEDNSEEETKDPDEKVKSGDLAVTAEANNGKAILADAVSDMDTLTFKTSEEVEITRVTLERYGYSSADDIASVWLEDEYGTVISTDTTATIDSKGQVKLSLKKDYRSVDGTLNATVVVKTTATAGIGNKTIGFKVIDVVSTAKNVNLDNYSPYTYTVVSYAGSDAILSTRSATKTYNWEAGESYEVAKFKLKAPADTAILVKSFILKDFNGNQIAFDDYVEDLTVTVAGSKVKSSYRIDGKESEITINLDNVELAAKENAEVVVSVKFSDDFDRMGKTVNFYLANASDISATDAKTESRVTVKALATYSAGDPEVVAGTAKVGDHKPYVGTNTEWYTCKFDGGKVRITSTKLGNVDASEDSTDILVAEGEISTNQTIRTTTANPITISVDGSAIVRAMRLVIAGDEYEGKPNAGKTVFTFPTIEIDHTSKIKLLVDTNETAAKNLSTTFTITNLDKFQYTDANDKTAKVDIAGSLNISKLTIADSEADLTNTLTSNEVEFKANETSEEVEILKGTYKPDQRDVNLKEFSLSTAAANWDPNHKLTAYLYVGGKVVADAKLELSGANYVAYETFSNVLVKAGESTDVVVTAVVEAKALSNPNPVDSIQFTLKLKGEDKNGNENSGVAEKKTAKISIVEKGTAEVVVDAASKTVLLRGSSDGIAQFRVKPSGSSKLDLESVSFDQPTGIACEALRLEGANKNFTTSGSTCVADGFVKSVDKEGLVLSIEFKDTPDAATGATNGLVKTAVNNLKINGKDANETFTKAYADGIIKFTQSGDGKARTTYTVADIQGYNANTKVRDIHFYDKNGDVLNTDLGSDEVLTKGKEFTIQNSCSGEIQIMKMTYRVVRGTYDEVVTIDHATYPDYFKTTGGDKLAVYANSKDNCKADTVVTVSTALAKGTVAAGDLAGWGYPLMVTSDFHSADPVINASAKTITANNTTFGSAPWTTGPLANFTKFVVLTIDSTNAEKVEVKYTGRSCGDDAKGWTTCGDDEGWMTVAEGDVIVAGIAATSPKFYVRSTVGTKVVTDEYTITAS